MKFTDQTSTAVDANDTSSVTAGLDIKENSYVSWSIKHKTGSRTTYVFTLQCSTDNTNWENTSSTINAAAGAFKLNDNTQITARYVRVKCTTAEGSSSTVDVVINAK